MTATNSVAKELIHKSREKGGIAPPFNEIL